MHKAVAIVKNVLIFIIFFFFNSLTFSQTLSIKGQLLVSGLTSNDIPNNWQSFESIIGYIPTFSLKKELYNEILLRQN